MATPDSVRSSINSLHQAIADHSDPECKTLLTQALQVVMKVQQRDYQQATDHAQTSAASYVGGGLNRSN